MAQSMNLEFFGSVSIYLGIGVQVLMALLLGGLVGYERESKSKSAGIKTNILICLGATLYTTIGLLVAVSSGGPADPNRIAAQIVSGIGFLGAGAIMQSKGNITGMTTAATIWVVAAIGFTVGAGYPFSAAFFTITVLIILRLLHPVYKLIEREKDFKFFEIEILARGRSMEIIRSIANTNELLIESADEEPYDKKGRKMISLAVYAHERQVERFTYDLNSILKIEKVTYHTIDIKDETGEISQNLTAVGD